MIGYLSYVNFFLLFFFSFGALAFIAWMVADAIKATENPTVEAEDSECRGVVSAFPQHNGSSRVSLGSVWEDDCDDPIPAIVADLYRAKQ